MAGSQKKIIKYESIQTLVNALNTGVAGANSAADNANQAATDAQVNYQQVQDAISEALTNSDVDANYISYTLGTQPDTAGATEGIIGAYFKTDGTLQKLELQSGAWVEIGEAISTKKYVDDKASLYSVRQIGLDGSGSAQDSTLLNNFIASNTPRTLFFPKGEYMLQNITLESGWGFVGEGFHSTLFYLPAGATNDMFVGSNSVIEEFNFDRIELRGIGTSGPNGINLAQSLRCNQGSIERCYINNFKRGVSGSQNDRYLHFSGNRIWNNDIGVYIRFNHPNFGVNDIRGNRIGVSGDTLYDIEFTQTKFVRNDYGVFAEDGSIRQSSFVNCMFFGNKIRHAVIGNRVSIANSIIALADGGSDVGIEIQGNNCSVINNRWRNEGGSHDYTDAGVLMNVNSIPLISTKIDGNNIQNLTTFVRVSGNPSTNRGTSVSDNVADGISTLYISSGLIPNGDQICKFSGNTINLKGGAGSPNVIEIGNTIGALNVGHRIVNNGFHTLSDSHDGHVIAGDIQDSIVKNNIIRRTAGIDQSASSGGAIIKDNIYTP